MRFSDWSSDVCSSDLVRQGGLGQQSHRLLEGGEGVDLLDRLDAVDRVGCHGHGAHGLLVALVADVDDLVALAGADRSEEHTSELQSLMRTSYAVFCLKKKQLKSKSNKKHNQP